MLGSRAPARVFASFERSCYVETQDGIACVGGPQIGRAHLACAAAGEGHEALHNLLSAFGRGKTVINRALAELARVGHSSGMDAAAGALLSLDAVWRSDGDWKLMRVT